MSGALDFPNPPVTTGTEFNGWQFDGTKWSVIGTAGQGGGGLDPSAFVLRSGSTMTGPLVVQNARTAPAGNQDPVPLAQLTTMLAGVPQGTITQINTGSGLTGGPVSSGAATLAVDTSVIATHSWVTTEIQALIGSGGGATPGPEAITTSPPLTGSGSTGTVNLGFDVNTTVLTNYLPLAAGAATAVAPFTFNLVRTNSAGAASVMPNWGRWGQDQVFGGYSADNNVPVVLGLQRARAGGAAVQQGDSLGQFAFWSTPGIASGDSQARIEAAATETHTTTAHGTRMAMYITPNGQTNPLEMYGIGANGAFYMRNMQVQANWWNQFIYGTGANEVWGIDAPDPDYGRIAVYRNGNLTIAGATATKASGTAWANPSDARLKRDVTEYRGGLNEVMQLRPITYSFNGEGGLPDDGKRHIGLEAEAVRKVVPAMVGKAMLRGEDYLTVDTSELIYMLLNAVKQLHVRLEEIDPDADT